MIQKAIMLLGLVVSLSISATALAVEPTQGMTITGDQELPQVLYIIPWREQPATMPQAPEMEEPIQRPLTPCDTGQSMSDYLTDLWNCDSKERPGRR
ncbi:MAG: hypothetical protein V7752_18480 [Halopseudomonas sp.]